MNEWHGSETLDPSSTSAPRGLLTFLVILQPNHPLLSTRSTFLADLLALKQIAIVDLNILDSLH